MFQDIVNFFRRQRAPITMGVLAALGGAFVIGRFMPGLAWAVALVRPGPGVSWAWLTYPLAVAFSDPFSLVLSGFWFYMAGGSLEISWGRRRYSEALLLAIPACSLPLLLGSLLLGRQVVLAGIALPLASLTILWCLANPDGLVLLGFFLPIPVRLFLFLEYLLVYCYASRSYGFVLGLFALGGPGLAYLYDRRSGPGRRWRDAVRYSNQRRKRQQEKRPRLRRIK